MTINNQSNIELYLVRHAESEMNLKRHYIGGRSTKTPLTATGIEQAKKLGSYLAAQNMQPDLVYASPAVRTRQTAEHALKAIGWRSAPILIDGLQEMDAGEWTGKLRERIYVEAVLKLIKSLGKDFAAPGGESMNDVGRRMRDWTDNKLAQDADNIKKPVKVLAFSHGVAIRCLASSLHNWSHMKTFMSETDNTSISLFTRKNGEWRLEYLGKGPK